MGRKQVKTVDSDPGPAVVGLSSRQLEPDFVAWFDALTAPDFDNISDRVRGTQGRKGQRWEQYAGIADEVANTKTTPSCVKCAGR